MCRIYMMNRMSNGNIISVQTPAWLFRQGIPGKSTGVWGGLL
jgi:hypothetical protein